MLPYGLPGRQPVGGESQDLVEGSLRHPYGQPARVQARESEVVAQEFRVLPRAGGPPRLRYADALQFNITLAGAPQTRLVSEPGEAQAIRRALEVDQRDALFPQSGIRACHNAVCAGQSRVSEPDLGPVERPFPTLLRGAAAYPGTKHIRVLDVASGFRFAQPETSQVHLVLL